METGEKIYIWVASIRTKTNIKFPIKTLGKKIQEKNNTSKKHNNLNSSSFGENKCSIARFKEHVLFPPDKSFQKQIKIIQQKKCWIFKQKKNKKRFIRRSRVRPTERYNYTKDYKFFKTRFPSRNDVEN